MHFGNSNSHNQQRQYYSHLTFLLRWCGWRIHNKGNVFQAFLGYIHDRYRGWQMTLLLDEDSSYTAGASQQMAKRFGVQLLWFRNAVHISIRWIICGVTVKRPSLPIGKMSQSTSMSRG